MITCPHCGFQAPDGMAECPRCGADMRPAPRERRVPNIPKRPQDPLPERPASDRSSGKISWPLILLGLAIAVLIFFTLLKT